MPAVPAIIGAAGSIGAGIIGARASKKAGQLSPIEQQGQRQQVQAGGQLGEQGTMLSRYGKPMLEQSGRYYSSLASGNRATVAQAAAPQVEQTNAVYGGTQRTLRRFLRGPDRDYQLGELERERAGSVSSIFRNARSEGVAGMSNLAQYATDAGRGALMGAAGIGSDLSTTGMQNRIYTGNLQRQIGSDTADMIFAILKGVSGMRRPGAGGPAGTGGKAGG